MSSGRRPAWCETTLAVAAIRDGGNLAADDAVPLHPASQRMDRRVGRHMRGVELEAGAADLPDLAQPGQQPRRIAGIAGRLQQPEAAVEGGLGAFVAFGRQFRRQYPGFRGAPHVQPLDHAAGVRPAEGQQAAAQRGGDAQRIGQLPLVQSHQKPGRHRAAIGSGQPRGVEAALFRRVQRGVADAEHHLDAGDDGPDHRGARGAPGAGHRQRRQRHGGAGMHSGAGAAQAVEFEGMRLDPPGQRLGPLRAGPRRRQRQRRSLGEPGDFPGHARPGEPAAEHRAADGIGQDRRRKPDHIGRQRPLAHRNREGGEFRDGRGGHGSSGGSGSMNAASTRK